MGNCNTTTHAEADSKKASMEKSNESPSKNVDGDVYAFPEKANPNNREGVGKSKGELGARARPPVSVEANSESISISNPRVVQNEPVVSKEAKSTTTSSKKEEKMRKYYQAYYEKIRQVPHFREIQKSSFHLLCVSWGTLLGKKIIGGKMVVGTMSQFLVDRAGFGVIGPKDLVTSSHWCSKGILKRLGCEDRSKLLIAIKEKIKGVNRETLKEELKNLEKENAQIEGSGVRLFAVFCKTNSDFNNLSDLIKAVEQESGTVQKYYSLAQYMLNGIGDDAASQTVFPIVEINPSPEEYWDVQTSPAKIRTSDIGVTERFPGLTRRKMEWNHFGTDMMFMKVANEIENDDVLLHLRIPIVDPRQNIENVFILPRVLTVDKGGFFENLSLKEGKLIFDDGKAKAEFFQFCEGRCFLERNGDVPISKIEKCSDIMMLKEGTSRKTYLKGSSSSKSLVGIAKEPAVDIDKKKRVSKVSKTKKLITQAPSIQHGLVDNPSKKVDILESTNEIDYEKISSFPELDKLLQGRIGTLCPVVFGRSCKEIKVSYEIEVPLKSLTEEQTENLSALFYRSKSENELEFFSEIDEHHSPKKCSKENVTELLQGGVQQFLKTHEAKIMGYTGELQKFTKLYDPMPYREKKRRSYNDSEDMDADLRSYQSFHHFSLLGVPGVSGNPVCSVIESTINEIENSILESIHTTVGTFCSALHVPVLFPRQYDISEKRGGSKNVHNAQVGLGMKVYVESPKFVISVSSFQCVVNSEMYLDNIASETQLLLTKLAKSKGRYKDAFSAKLQLFKKMIRYPLENRKQRREAEEKNRKQQEKIQTLQRKLKNVGSTF